MKLALNLSRNFTILAYNYMYLHIKTLPLKVNYILQVFESPFQLQIPMILIFFPPFLCISIFFFELNKVGYLYHRVCYKGLLVHTSTKFKCDAFY